MDEIRVVFVWWRRHRYLPAIPLVGLVFMAVPVALGILGGGFVWEEWRLPLGALGGLWLAISLMFGLVLAVGTLVERHDIRRTLADPWAVWPQHTDASWSPAARPDVEQTTRREARAPTGAGLVTSSARAVLGEHGVYHEDRGFRSLRHLDHAALVGPDASGWAVMRLTTRHRDHDEYGTQVVVDTIEVRVPPGFHSHAEQVLARYATERQTRTSIVSTSRDGPLGPGTLA